PANRCPGLAAATGHLRRCRSSPMSQHRLVATPRIWPAGARNSWTPICGKLYLGDECVAPVAFVFSGAAARHSEAERFDPWALLFANARVLASELLLEPAPRARELGAPLQ